MRPHLFNTNEYARHPTGDRADPWPRPGRQLAELFVALTSDGHCIGEAVRRIGPELGFKQTALYYPSVFVDEPPAWELDGTRTAQTKVGWLRFASESERDVAFVLLAGRLSNWWWGATGDDFDVTKGLLASFPIGPSQVEKAWPELIKFAAQLRKEQQRHPLVTNYAGRATWNYYISPCRHS